MSKHIHINLMHVNSLVELNRSIQMSTVTHLRCVCKPKPFVVMLQSG